MNGVTNGNHPRPPASNRHLKCRRMTTPHSGCHHEVESFLYCGGHHPNEHFACKACYESPGLPPGQTQRNGANPGYCSVRCRANGTGWYCCQCTAVYNQDIRQWQKQLVGGRWVGNDVWHYAVNGQEHIYCSNCSFSPCIFLIFGADLSQEYCDNERASCRILFSLCDIFVQEQFIHFAMYISFSVFLSIIKIILQLILCFFTDCSCFSHMNIQNFHSPNSSLYIILRNNSKIIM